jgi:hypothetical protein
VAGAVFAPGGVAEWFHLKRGITNVRPSLSQLRAVTIAGSLLVPAAVRELKIGTPPRRLLSKARPAHDIEGREPREGVKALRLRILPSGLMHG